MHERDILLCSVVVGPLLVAWLQSKRRLLGASTLSPCLIIIRSIGVVIQVIIWRRRVGFVDGKFFWPFLLEELVGLENENENSFCLWAKKYPWFWILGKEWLSKDLNLNSKFEVFNFWYEKSFQDCYIYFIVF